MDDNANRGQAREMRRFVIHLLQMVAAMVAGMLLLAPLWTAVLPPAATDRADLAALVMATDMAIGMAVWMRFRRHGWVSIAEMGAAMYVPFLLLFIPYWAGGISGSAVTIAGHALMLPAMVAVMLRRRDEYTRPHRRGVSLRRQRWTRRLIRTGVVIVAVGVPPAVVGTVSASSYQDSLYQPAADVAVPAAVRAAAPPHDPAKPTAVVLVGNQGAHVADTLGPYETLAATGAFNLYVVAPERRLVPLTGGLDLVPDLSLAEVDQRLAGRAADLIAVPQLPDPAAASSRPLRAWLTEQARGGALLLGVCTGSEVLAAAGLLDGRDATSHWFRVGGLEQRYPSVRWHRGTRYVDDGNIITTGGVLSGIDGTLRVIERLLGRPTAATAAAAVGWRFYSPGTPAPLPQSTFALRDTVAGVNLTFRPHRTIGVLLTNGVGEIEVASVFGTYTEAAYAARTVAVGVGSTAPVRSRHGLIFVPRADAFTRSDLDRLLIPGADAARRADPALSARAKAALDLTPDYVHAQPGFAFDGALRDMARTVDVPTARWRAKTLEYPTDGLTLTGPGWPWGATLLPLRYSLIGLACAIALWLATRTVRARRAARPVTAPSLAGTAADRAPATDPATDRAAEMAGR